MQKTQTKTCNASASICFIVTCGWSQFTSPTIGPNQDCTDVNYNCAL